MNSAEKNLLKTNSIAATLLRLEGKSKFLYNLLNAIADLLIKPIPIFVWMLFTNGENLFDGENAIQSTIFFGIGIIGAYLASIVWYLSILAMIQVVKLFVCTYKPLVIHFRVFDIIIKLSSKKIQNGNDKELQDLLYNHEYIIEARKEKRENRKSRAYESKRQRDMAELENAQKEYEKALDRAQDNMASAEYNYQKAKEGGTLFFSAETKLEEAESDYERAKCDKEDARYYKEMIRAKKRALGIKGED